MADKTITGIVTWLKGWFYDKDEITTKENALQTQINNKASQTDLNTLSSTVSGKLDASDYIVDSALSSSSNNPVQNNVINTALNNKANSTHSHTTTDVTESSALSHIGTSANATQSTINTNINTKLGAKAEKSEVIDWDTLTFVAKADDSTGAITFDYLE